MWNLEGQTIQFRYLGCYPILTGEVVESRVKFGGKVQHRVRLNKPIEIYGTRREYLLATEDELVDTAWI